MYIPHTDDERNEMLKAIGVNSMEDLFAAIPEEYRFPKLHLPDAMTEMEILDALQEISSANSHTKNLVSFLGAGAYNHYIPAAVDNILRRGEFFTAYTPYQAEISQGTLQTIYEYQSLITALTGMDVSNASHYDGATAAAEACLMAYHHFRGKRNKMVLSPAVNPLYRGTIRTYLEPYEDINLAGDGAKIDPLSSPDTLIDLIDNDTSIVLVQYPDFFGRIHNYTKLAEAVHAEGALLAVVANPTALGLLTPPGEFGADIVVGDGQPLGIPLSFGGPYLGFFATKEEFVRKLTGRLVGETTDSEGRRGFVLTLTAREQHIRREKAKSNICSNQGLMVLASTLYMSLLGKSGMKKVAELCYQKAHYAAEEIANTDGYTVLNNTPFFHEFVVKCDRPLDEYYDHLIYHHDLIPGYDLGQDYPSLKNHLLINVTEMISRAEIDMLRDALQEVSND
jgi:glycine dehydrogenase subunit 1